MLDFRMGRLMRTTIDLRDDVLQAAREQAAIERVSMGELLSRWAERGRYASPAEARQNATPTDEPVRSSGFLVVLPRRNGVVTTELVRQLMDEEGI
jgi:hypothetical protein